jgi:hypothetical protein
MKSFWCSAVWKSILRRPSRRAPGDGDRRSASVDADILAAQPADDVLMRY